jgi:hypothetical protein
MSNRALLILIAVLVALIVLANLGGRDTPSIAAGERFLPQLATGIDDVERVTIARAGNETVATLERDGASWTVRERQEYPADATRIRDALIALTEARIVEPKTASARFYARLGVEPIELDTAAGIAITLEGLAQPLTVILGDTAPGGHRFARRADQAESYQIDRDPTLPRDTANWLTAEILDLAGERVRHVTITHADGEVVRLEKAEAGQMNFSVEPIPEGRELLYPGVGNTIGSALRALRLEDVERAADGFDAEVEVEVEYITFDGLVIRARGARRNGAAWAEFVASAAEDLPADQADARQQEAGEINRRVAGWRFRIAPFQYEQLTRRMADLLQGSA